jgi:hypothetical protein
MEEVNEVVGKIAPTSSGFIKKTNRKGPLFLS